MPFHNLGLLIGLFSPRCADLWPATRQEAVSCVHSLLYLQLGYEGEPPAGPRCGGMRSRVGASGGRSPPPGSTRPRASAGFARDYRDDAVERLLVLKEGLVHSDPATLFHTCHSIAQVPAGAPTACWGPGTRVGAPVPGGLCRAPGGHSTGQWARDLDGVCGRVSLRELAVWHRL